MKKKNLLFVLAGLFLLVSCSNSEDDTAANQGKAIEFRSVVDKTKASLSSDLQSFFVKGQQVNSGSTYAEFLSASVYKDGANWTYSPKKYWPVDGETVNFYAFAPYSSTIVLSNLTTGTDVSITDYTVPLDQSIQNTAVDFLVAKGNGSNQNGSTPISLTFKHALSAATFSAINKNETTSELVYTISKIEIIKVDEIGTYNYSTEAWEDNSDKTKTYIAGVPASGVAVQPVGASGAAVNLLSANDVLMVLPQAPDIFAKVKVTYSLKDGAGVDIYKDATKELGFPMSFEFEAGKRYNFVFSSDASNAITLSATVTPWTSSFIGTEIP
ncbi:MAG: fimbrillin family protein [Prevotella sp.]|jgi:hypothetical protein|nr:fimbrillin family protein [Prevotella sp.]